MRKGIVFAVVLFVFGSVVFAEDAVNVEKLFDNYKTLKKAALELKKENEKQKNDIEAIRNALIEEYNGEVKAINDSLDEASKIAPKDFSAAAPLEIFAAIKGLKEKKAVKEVNVEKQSAADQTGEGQPAAK